MLNFLGQIPVVGRARPGKKGMSPYQMVGVNFSLDGGPQRKKKKNNKQIVFPFSTSKLSQLAIIAYALRMPRHCDQALVKCQFTTHLEHTPSPKTLPPNKQTNNQPTAYRRQEPPLKKQTNKQKTWDDTHRHALWGDVLVFH